jgi:WD40 repeat protein
VNCSTALLCSDIHSESGTVVVGTFDKKVKMFDMRSAKPTVMNVKHHKMPVLAVAALPNSSFHMISASEDGTLAMMDRRTRKVIKRLHFDSFPMCMKLMDEGVNCLVVGDKSGGLHLIDANKMEEIKVLKNLHSNKITDIDVSMSGIVTTSSDKTVKILQPDMSLNPIATLQVEDIGDVVSVSMDNDCLAAGSSSELIQVWRPKIDRNSNEIQEQSN